jgi:hypothetical protein
MIVLSCIIVIVQDEDKIPDFFYREAFIPDL